MDTKMFYRGFSTLFEKWVYGELSVTAPNFDYKTNTDKITFFIVECDGEYVECYEKSIGKSTGRLDSRGVMIYEGDILFHEFTNTINFVSDNEGFVIYPIRKKHNLLDFDIKNGKSMDYSEEYEVVSNLFCEMLNL